MRARFQRALAAGLQTSTEFWFPPVCPGCDLLLASDSRGACKTCRPRLELEGPGSDNRERCERCHSAIDTRLDRSLQESPPGSGRCSFCASRRVFFDRHRAMLPMRGLWREVVHRWKYENDRRLWRVFWSLCFSAETLDELRNQSFDRIVWIDSGSAGRQLRNYQPCADVGRALALALRPAWGHGADLRKQKSKQQSARAYADRFFSVHNSLEFRGAAGPSKYLLIEDVFTTGATANEAARILKKNGAFHVFVLSLLLRDG
jgi:competence protein ComFC